MDNIVVRTDLAVEANEEAMNGTGKLQPAVQLSCAM